MIYAIGIDPGSRGAVALVSHTGRKGELPTAIGAWGIYGRWPDLWYERAREASRNSVARWIPGDLDREACRFWGKNPPIVWQERFPAKSRGARISPTAWIGLGRRCGALLAAFHGASGVWPTEVENSAWREVWGLPGKGNNPAQRIAQAAMYVRGSRAVLDEVRPSCVVDAAEALLIAGAAVMMEVGR